MKLVFEMNQDSIYIQPRLIYKNAETPPNCVTMPPINGLYRAKWTGAEWIEDMTQEEIDELNNQPSLPTQEERIDMLENMILMMMEV